MPVAQSVYPSVQEKQVDPEEEYYLATRVALNNAPRVPGFVAEFVPNGEVAKQEEEKPLIEL